MPLLSEALLQTIIAGAYLKAGASLLLIILTIPTFIISYFKWRELLLGAGALCITVLLFAGAFYIEGSNVQGNPLPLFTWIAVQIGVYLSIGVGYFLMKIKWIAKIFKGGKST